LAVVSSDIADREDDSNARKQFARMPFDFATSRLGEDISMPAIAFVSRLGSCPG
jgi:hypothetical protein